ncbi:serine protease inhibitor-like SPI-2 [Goatpox virus]|nr:serpin [Goatpox virus FZ]AWX92156.1 serpin [Goatpox virus]AWX92157.1 serpin [Goatpox virus]AWX92158.1 serpin [Goatpox virus]AWX92159.1 serpin [Goatpox virus]
MDIFTHLLSIAFPNSNVLISPVSISSILSILLFGSSGDTAIQISSLLESTYSNYCSDDIIIANRIYGDLKLHFKTQFIDKFGKELILVNFNHNTELIKNDINEWIKKLTHDKIKNLINEISENTKLLLLNAVYFKLKWRIPFDKQQTKMEKFWYDNSRYENIEMMNDVNVYPFIELKELGLKIIELPYENNYSMIILLPKDIKKIEKILTGNSLTSWIEKMNLYEVNVKIPKFKIEETYDLKLSLISLGIINIFDGSADFSNMTKNKNLSVDNFYHKTYIEIDEEGAELSAASYCCVADCGCNEKEFIANKPFIFFIKDNINVSFLFIGKFSFPHIR